MKKLTWIMIPVIVLLILIFAFPRVSKTYIFPNTLEDITSIEFLINFNEVGEANEDKLLLQKTLSKEEIGNFMKEIYALETRRCYPPMWGWGEYIAKVSYSNGDIEFLGSDNIEYIKCGSTATGDGPYVFWGHGIFEEVFFRYLE